MSAQAAAQGAGPALVLAQLAEAAEAEQQFGARAPGAERTPASAEQAEAVAEEQQLEARVRAPGAAQERALAQAAEAVAEEQQLGAQVRAPGAEPAPASAEEELRLAEPARASAPGLPLQPAGAEAAQIPALFPVWPALPRRHDIYPHIHPRRTDSRALCGNGFSHRRTR